MPRIKVSEIATITKGRLIGNPQTEIEHIIFDSRRNFDVSNSMFVAINGERHDGHFYINSLYKKGLRAFLVEKNINLDTFSDASFIVVENSVSALQRLVAYHRSSTEVPVVGITGSNGKTIVKEWLSQALSTKLSVTCSPKSYNSQIGVPLSVWLLNNNTEIGVFEAGISMPGEMKALEEVIQPTHGIITNIGEAHQQYFNSQQQKLHEKLQLFTNCQAIYYCMDHQQIDEAIRTLQGIEKKKVYSWSLHDAGAGLHIKSMVKEKSMSRILITFRHEDTALNIPFTDKASIENCLHVINFLLCNEFNFEEVQTIVEQLHPVAMRLEQVKGINNCTLINDAYNSDINALGIALDYLNQLATRNKVLILSDFQQTSIDKEQLYMKVGKMLEQASVNRLIGIGKDLSAHAACFDTIKTEFFTSTSDFIESLVWRTFSEDHILIKGARGFHFERIVQLISEKNHTTQLEINLNHLNENLNYYRSLTSESTRIMVMVKALAYGSGGNEIAQMLQHEKVDYLGVAFTDEGVQLRQSGIHLPIMVMAPAPEDFSRIIEYDLEPEIFSLKILNAFISAAERAQVKSFPIHIKLDTGMHRLGFMPQEVDKLIEQLKRTGAVRLQALFSHLAASNDPGHDEFSYQQIALFSDLYASISKGIGYSPMRHILNSAGIERFPKAHFEMVRLGIGLHGISTTKKLLPVSTLKTHIVQIKEVHAGETVGYSRRGKALSKKRIAIIPIGYADGLDRKLGNGRGYVCLGRNKAYFIGSICMDLSMIDITGLNCDEGDEVVIFGEEPSIVTVAEKIDTIPYEVLTNVSSRVKRVYLKD